MNRQTLLAISSSVFAVTLTVGSIESNGALVNISQLPGVSASQSSTGSGGVASRAIDNNTDGVFTNNSVTHTDGGDATDPQTWTLSIPSVVRIKQVDIYNRTDCCGGRLRDITLDTIGSGTVLGSSPELNNDNGLGGGLTDFGTGPAVLSHTFPAFGALGNSLRVSRAAYTGVEAADNVRVLAMAEVVASGYVLTNIAQGKPATQTSTLGGFVATDAVNGNFGDFSHTENTDANPSLTIDLGQLEYIDSIRLHNRENCCGGRLRDIVVELLDTDGSTVLYTSPLLNPGNVLGGGIGDFSNGPSDLWLDFYQLLGSPTYGQFVRISRTNVTTGDDNTAVLALGEVQVFSAVPEPSALSLVLFGSLVIMHRLRRRG